MQAQPQSNLAARIPSAPPSAPSPSSPSSIATPPSASHATPSLAHTLGLAHDAGNLLAALGLYCDLLSVPGVLRPEHQHYATELSLISNRSSKLIQRLLTTLRPAAPLATTPDYTQQDHTQPDPTAALALPPTLIRRPVARSFGTLTTTSNPAPPSLADTLRNLAPILQRIASGAATVTVTCPASLPSLDFPSEVIERITINLVRNAAEAIRIHRGNAPSHTHPPSGEIHVALAVVASRLQLTVEDNGPGMPPAIAAAYLQPSPLPRGASRGLGHRIVHELAASTEGQLSIRVRPGHGTVFCLKWPIPSNALAEPCPLVQPPSAVPSTPSRMTA